MDQARHNKPGSTESAGQPTASSQPKNPAGKKDPDASHQANKSHGTNQGKKGTECTVGQGGRATITSPARRNQIQSQQRPQGTDQSWNAKKRYGDLREDMDGK